MHTRRDPHPRDPARIGELHLDHVLAQRALTDPEAFAELYRRYLTPVYGYCYRRLGSREAAEDATSQIFTRALEALPTFHSTHFRAWLFTIAHRTVIDTYRRHPRTVDIAMVEPLLPTVQFDEASLASLELEALYGALTVLTGDQRQVVELRLAGLSGPEIREVLGRSRSWVDTTQFRALQRLRKVLTSEEVSDA
jgi:RNA polymerase sigma-70 factor, ECF subfamily